MIAAPRLIRDTFAVRLCLGDQQVVPYFRCAFLLGMPWSRTPLPIGECFRGFPGSLFAAACRVPCPLAERAFPPCYGDSYLRAFRGSVILRAVGYNHGSNRASSARRDLHPQKLKVE
jgi:hypothetical protein